jgi:hypothetical protein
VLGLLGSHQVAAIGSIAGPNRVAWIEDTSLSMSANGGNGHADTDVADTDQFLFFDKCYPPHGCDRIVGASGLPVERTIA